MTPAFLSVEASMVEVAERSWPTFVYVPHNASVYINCTTDSSSPFWSIDPAEDGLNTPLQFATRAEALNDEGLYNINVAAEMTLRLLINNTEVNNQTKIECVGETVTLGTVIFLYGKLMLYAIAPITFVNFVMLLCPPDFFYLCAKSTRNRMVIIFLPVTAT
jgi:hypothetical protein